MIKVTYFIGLNDKDTKTQLISTEEAIKIIQKHNNFVTIQIAEGSYKMNSDKTVVKETTLIITKFISNEEFKIAEYMMKDVYKNIFNQETIGIEVNRNCEFYYM